MQIFKGTPIKSRRLQIIECEARIRKIQKVLPPENPGFVAGMDHLANLYLSEGKFGLAKSIYQRAALLRKDTLGPCHITTLENYLEIINIKRLQGRYSEALTLHQDLHAKIQKLFSPCHNLGLGSRILLARILRSFGEYEDSEMLETHRAMAELGKATKYRQQYA